MQIDLVDLAFGEAWRVGIAALPEPDEIRALSAATERDVRAAREGAADGGAVDAAGAELAAWVEDVVRGLLERQRKPLLLGGEHGVSFGALRAAAAREPGLGVLQIDAHADLRDSYEGFQSSHACVMARALELEGIDRLVQVGLRDVSPEERERARAEPGRITWHGDDELARRRQDGERFSAIAAEIVSSLPERVWITFDVDGLDPSLCPGTGTPVPGGLSWHEAGGLLRELRTQGREVVGADLVEIGPGGWDGYVAAKLAYRLAALLAGPVEP
jgi:agmatinase